ncbi:MAG: glycoside hydrolase family 65 protein [Candidatus Omnitrophica bacterium]|nr:glycoside hydrolase family 65 protein [Candidatus Omnitrophota bacterium]
MIRQYMERFHRIRKDWTVSEKSWEPSALELRETQFTLGNGAFGSRGIYEELPQDSLPGTFMAGFYDRVGSQVAELVNIPNPFRLSFTLRGEQLGIGKMDHSSHRRDLDLKHGILFRHTQYRDTKKRRYDYRSVRFLSMADRHLGVMHADLTATDAAAEIDVEGALDMSVWNSGTVTEGRKKHWRIREVSNEGGFEYVRIEGLENNYSVGFATALLIRQGTRKWVAKDSHFKLRLRKGQTVSVTKIFVIHGTQDRDPDKLLVRCVDHLRDVIKAGAQQVARQHIRTWDKLWSTATITIKGAPHDQKALRFNTYHLLACAPAPGSRGSIGAKTLSGDGYRGHIFWDSDIFLMPFFTHTYQNAAVDMLLYRYDRLNPAREIAKKFGYRGAMYPWESAGAGTEETPAWAKGLDGSVIEIFTHEQEHHITADIAYAVNRYYTMTGDDNFMLDCGFEMLFETARFWASRVEYNRRTKFYSISNVIGPDEFHEKVSDNAYTNMLAKWNLLNAHRMAAHMKKDYPREFTSLCRRINLRPSEIDEWKQIAPRIAMKVRDDGVIEQFDGYFKLRRVRLAGRDAYGLPKLPKNFQWSGVQKTQLLKQADVLMLIFLLSDVFNTKTKKVNYQFYEPRTTHKSSLSAGMHTIPAAELGEKEAAYNFFRAAAFLDLENVMNNTHEGIHAASLGNVWMATIYGFAGLTHVRDELHIKPRLPKAWSQLSFSYRWKETDLKFVIEADKVKLTVRSNRKTLPGRIKVYGKYQEFPVNKAVAFSKSGKQ